MIRPGLRLLRTLLVPLMLVTIVSLVIYTQDYFTPGYSGWLLSNPFKCPMVNVSSQVVVVKEEQLPCCQTEAETEKKKATKPLTHLWSPLTLKKSVTSSGAEDSGMTSSWETLYSPEHVRRREHAHNACLREDGRQEVDEDLVYLVRVGLTSDPGQPAYCGSPPAALGEDGAEGGVPLNGMVAYCGVPKVACSFWLTVFRHLCNDTNGLRYDHPLLMPKSAVHYYSFDKIRTELHKMADDFRFMFVREPYSRLWSAYLDKLYLPDFWFNTGNVITKQLHKKGLRKQHSTCGGDISFNEFVDYVVAYEGVYHNNHWKPLHLQCSPCLYRPHFIGKLETFASDVRLLLKHLNASWIMDDLNQTQRVHNEVQQLINYNYEIVKRDSHKNCTNSTADLPRRLWAAFQYNGYIPSGSGYPFPVHSPVTKGQLRTAARAAVDAGKATTKDEWRRQREVALMAAYKTVSTETLVKLRDLYWTDFVMYDYDPEPPLLFKGRQFLTRTFRGQP